MRPTEEALDMLRDLLQIEPPRGHGSDRALARVLKISSAAITNWKSRGVNWSTLSETLTPEQFKRFGEWFHGGEAAPKPKEKAKKSNRTRGDDLVLAQKTVSELIGDGPGFSDATKAELTAMALDELRELRVEGREEQFRRRLLRLVDFAKSIALENYAKASQEKPLNVSSAKPKP